MWTKPYKATCSFGEGRGAHVNNTLQYLAPVMPPPDHPTICPFSMPPYATSPTNYATVACYKPLSAAPQCLTDPTRENHLLAIYAYPNGNVTGANDRFNLTTVKIPDYIRSNIAFANGWVANESWTVNQERADLKFICDPNGQVTIRPLGLPLNPGDSHMWATYKMVTDNVTAIARAQAWPGRNREKYLIFWDDYLVADASETRATLESSGNGIAAAGLAAGVNVNDHSSSRANQNNDPGTFAMVARAPLNSNGTAVRDSVNYLDVQSPNMAPDFLHEFIHTMGFMQPDTTHYGFRYNRTGTLTGKDSSGASISCTADTDPACHDTAHCRDGSDVLCWEKDSDVTTHETDSSLAGNPVGHCTDYPHVDCNHNDYFYPGDAPSGYLNKHWNMGNRTTAAYLQIADDCGTKKDAGYVDPGTVSAPYTGPSTPIPGTGCLAGLDTSRIYNDRSEVDSYLVDLIGGTFNDFTVQANASTPATGTLDFALCVNYFHSPGSGVDCSYPPPGQPRFVRYNPPANGTAWLTIYAMTATSNMKTGTYTITRSNDGCEGPTGDTAKTQAGAMRLPNQGPFARYECLGTLSPGTDSVDWYKYYATAGSLLDVGEWTDYTSQTADVDICLYDPSGVQVTCSAERSWYPMEESLVNVTTTGWWGIKVILSKGSGTYDMWVSTPSGPTGEQDGCPNRTGDASNFKSSPTTPYTTPDGIGQGCWFDSMTQVDPADYYTINVATAHSKLTIWEESASINADVCLYDPTGAKAMCSNYPSSDPSPPYNGWNNNPGSRFESIIRDYDAATTGTWTIGVIRGTGTGGYLMFTWVGFPQNDCGTGADAPPPQQVFGVGPTAGDSASVSLPLAAATCQATFYNNDGDTQDHYSFTVTATTGFVNVRVRAVTTSQVVYACLLNPWSTSPSGSTSRSGPCAYGNDASVTPVATLSMAASPGTWDLQVYPMNGLQYEYSIAACTDSTKGTCSGGTSW